MFIDAHSLPNELELDADICVVGSGPAGLSLAREFRHSTTSIIILESGGLTPEPASQALAAPGQLQFGNVERLGCNRQFGGNASVWTVQTGATWFGIRLMPLPPADFASRDHMPESGWPIGRATLDPYYGRAQQVFKLGRNAYEGEDWATAESPALPLPAERIRSRMYQFGDGNLFMSEYRRELETTPNITVYYHATATELETSPSGAAVSAVRAMSGPGRGFRVRARHVVLAGGGLATTQLLLNSDAAHQGGIGNQSGKLGRYMMDHPYLCGGELVPTDRTLFERATLYDMRTIEGAVVMGHLQIADEVLVREPLLGLSMILFPRERNHLAHRSLSPRQQRGFDALVELRRELLRGQSPSGRHLGALLNGADGIVKRAVERAIFPKALIGRGGWSRLPFKGRRYHSFEVIQQAEQAPHADNRVVLHHERDALGMRRIAIDWRWHAEDIAATMRGQELYAAELRRAGLGEFQIAREDGAPKVLSHSTAHYMGTTRMHSSPHQGVVDAECRVHGIHNLYVASCSVFPTGGFANPTFTIVALALRIGDTLKAAQRREREQRVLRSAAPQMALSTVSAI